MSKTISRLLVFFIGVPVLLGLIICPWHNHLPLHLTICVAAALGACELWNIFAKDHKLLSKKFIVGCVIVICVVATLSAILPDLTGITIPGGQEVVTFVYILTILSILFWEAFHEKEFKDSIDRIVSSVFIITYVGFLLTFISRMTVWKIGGQNITIPCISIFLLMVIFTDSIAWFFGILLGKSTRGIVKASPNKSLVGFIGGFIGSVGIGIVCYYIWKDLFEGGLWKLVVTGILIAFSSIVGDLAESVFKRSADVKDSGTLIPGRGGVLDSIDSILMSAPIFYLTFSIFFGPFN